MRETGDLPGHSACVPAKQKRRGTPLLTPRGPRPGRGGRIWEDRAREPPRLPPACVLPGRGPSPVRPFGRPAGQHSPGRRRRKPALRPPPRAQPARSAARPPGPGSLQLAARTPRGLPPVYARRHGNARGWAGWMRGVALQGGGGAERSTCDEVGGLYLPCAPHILSLTHSTDGEAEAQRETSQAPLEQERVSMLGKGCLQTYSPTGAPSLLKRIFIHCLPLRRPPPPVPVNSDCGPRIGWISCCAQKCPARCSWVRRKGVPIK